ncbi:MAG: response regulator transcription factor [Saprospiraceae bacterium]|nr:response regulator transcription factor [Saprospiraceae bacterium]
MHTFKILLADDHQIVLDGLQEIVDTAAEFHVVGQAKNGRVLMSLLGDQQPDLILMDLNMPGKDGLEMLSEIKARFPVIKILVLTMYNSPEIVRRALSSGADGYLFKDHGRDELLFAIREVLAGRLFVSKQAKPLPDNTSGHFYDDFQAKTALTERELEILRLIARSYTNKEIGDKLFISEFTVATHRRNLKRKLQADNTADLIRFVYDHDMH